MTPALAGNGVVTYTAAPVRRYRRSVARLPADEVTQVARNFDTPAALGLDAWLTGAWISRGCRLADFDAFCAIQNGLTSEYKARYIVVRFEAFKVV